jgi:hypothetical protein
VKGTRREGHDGEAAQRPGIILIDVLLVVMILGFGDPSST